MEIVVPVGDEAELSDVDVAAARVDMGVVPFHDAVAVRFVVRLIRVAVVARVIFPSLGPGHGRAHDPVLGPGPGHDLDHPLDHDHHPTLEAAPVVFGCCFRRILRGGAY